MSSLSSIYTQLLYTNYKVNNSLKDLQTQYVTGNRINSAVDDSAGLAVSERLKSIMNSFNTDTQVLNDAHSIAQFIDGTYENVSDMLQDMRTLAVKYQSSTISSMDKDTIQKQLVSLQEEVNEQISNITYNNKKITTDSVNGKLSLSSYGDVVKVTDSTSLQMNSTSITLEAKVNLNSFNSGTPYDDRALVIGKDGNYYLTVNSTGSVGIYKYGSAPGGYRESVGKITLGQDTTISGVFEGTTAKIYINGKLDSTFTLKSAGYNDREADASIGLEDNNNFQRQLDGTIDDIRIYDRALSDTEVSSNYSGNITRDHLMGEWLFNDADSTAYDTSGNNNYGTLMGSATIQATTDPSMSFGSGSGKLDMNFSTLTLNKLGIQDLSQVPSDIVERLDRALDLVSVQKSKAGAYINTINYRVSNNDKLAAIYQNSINNIVEANMEDVSSELTKAQLQQTTVTKLLKQIQDTEKENLNTLLSVFDQ
ncbi:LamG-like jellyroll fold domain-containing protein [Priestia megaterium]